MTAPHEADRFRNAAVYTVEVTVTVAGGARPDTAHRRARVVAERIAAAAARLADVVDASAVAGTPGPDGTLAAGRTVHFANANTGRAARHDGDKLDRYVDPDHERGLASLAGANRQTRDRRVADRARRQHVGCLNTWRRPGGASAACTCVYCQPGRHLDLLTDPSATAMWTPRCLCGRPVPRPGVRCDRHTNTQIVVLDDDRDDLQALHDHCREVTS